MNAEEIRIEWDEHGPELLIETTDAGPLRFTLRGHRLIEQFYDTVKREIGPYLQEAEHARRLGVVRYVTGGPWAGETAAEYFDRTGDDGPLRDQADHAVKVAKENR